MLTDNELEEDRALHQRLRTALKEGNTKESTRIFKEMHKSGSIQKVLKQAIDMTIGKLVEARGKVELAEKQPKLPQVVLATMDELRDIGYWKKTSNSTYDLADTALKSYKQAEKNRVEYLAAKKAYSKALSDYIDKATELARNLVIKQLQPLEVTARDPLAWYLAVSKLIKATREAGFELSVPTLRKYQSFGLIPKPLRLGRKSYYSILTIERLAIIDHLKGHGIKLSDMKETIGAILKERIDKCYWMYAADRGASEVAYGTMAYLTDDANEWYFKLWTRHFDRKK